jgi:hypothetical protein
MKRSKALSKTRNQIPHPAAEAVFQLVNFPEDQNLSFQF